jgi:hypothetical protein
MPTRNSIRRSSGTPAFRSIEPFCTSTTQRTIDDAAKLDDAAVACALYDPPVMRGYRGVDQIASKTPQARQGAIFVGPASRL